MKPLFKKGYDGDFMDSLQHCFGLYGSNQNQELRPIGERKEIWERLSKRIRAAAFEPQRQMEKLRAKAFMTTADLPQPDASIWDLFRDVQNYDLAWQLAFKDMAAYIETGRDYWEVMTLVEASGAGGVTHGWRLIPEGGKVELMTLSGSETKVYVKKFGNGFGWTDEMIRFRKLARIVEAAEEFVSSYWRDKSDRFYTLLNSGIGGSVAYQTAEGSDEVTRDIATFDAAAFQMLNSLKDTRNLPLTTRLLFYVKLSGPQIKKRMVKAFNQLNQAVSGSPRLMQYNIDVVYSFNDNLPSPAGAEKVVGLLVLPGYKNQAATLEEMMMLGPETDILSLNRVQTAFSYYGGAVLDTNQILRVAFN